MIKTKLLEMLFGKHLDNIKKQAFQDLVNSWQRKTDQIWELF